MAKVVHEASKSSTSSTTTTPKLRDSCHACAASKLRCSKEKPTCARCAKRVKPCEYLATKRSGRKQGTTSSNSRGNSSRNNNNDSSTKLSEASRALPTPSVASSSAGGDTSEPSGADTMQAFLDQYHHNYSDAIPSPIFSTGGPAMADVGHDEIDLNFDDCFSSPIELSDCTSRAESHSNSWAMNGSLNPSSPTALPEKAFSLLDEPGLAIDPSLSLASQTSAANWPLYPTHSASSTPESSCDCAVQTFGLLRQLSGHSIATSGSSQSSTNDRPSPRPVYVSMADSEQAIEAVRTMLECSCSRDGYWLVLMSLVVFKALGWYETVARESPGTMNAARENLLLDSRSGRSAEDCEQGRLAAQSVLGKLHRVQGLVNTLSQRLRVNDARTREAKTSSIFSNSMVESSDFSIAALPFSATLLDQLEVDLRRRVRAVSASIVDILRHV